MKTKLFKTGRWTYKAYMKPVGKGWEVGFMYGTTPLFVGNFVHKPEATAWYTLMNKEYFRFSKRYGKVPPAARTFYHKFITNNLYKHYYDYLDKCFGKYTRNYHREFSTNEKKYNKMRKHWTPNTSVPYTRRAS